MKNTKKYLILQLQQACYSSYTYFTNQIARGLRACGHEVIIFSVENRPLEEIEQFEGAHFDAVIDCNSRVPRFTTEQDSYFLDEIHAPFFNLLLDHPLYHHDSLKCRLKNYHVRCLDENHAAYVRKYYPHIKSVGLWIATGSSATEAETAMSKTHAAISERDTAEANWHLPICDPRPRPIREREIPVLFSGTYTDPNEILRAIRELPSFIQNDINLLITELLEHPTQTIEGAIHELGDSLDSYLPDEMPLLTQVCFLADTYVRAHRRRALILAADKARLPLWLVGADWEKLGLPAGSTVSLHPSVPFTQSFSLMANSRITLNLMPEFKAGFHDRVFSAMLNGSVAATDPSKRLTQEFTDGQELIFYDIRKFDEACEHLRLLLERPKRLQHIADAGFAAGKRFSWNALFDRMKHV